LRRIALAILVFSAAACGVRAPVRYALTIDLDRDREHARVTTVTELDRSPEDVVRRRVQPIRDALAAERDEWSARFQQVRPSTERVIYDRQWGEIVRAEHSGVVEREQLARFFGDLPMTVTVVRGGGWTELAIYPGGSGRATRQQRETVERTLDLWSRDAATYLNRMSHLYQWIDQHPQLAEHAFTLLFEDDERAHAVDKEEDALVTAARQAMTAVTERLRRKEGEELPIDELFDLVYNPFPAAITVHTPRAIVGIEHFDKRGDDTGIIHHAGLLDAARALEGKWLSPDPLALVLRSEEDRFEIPIAAELGKMQRKWSQTVSADELQKAILAIVRPAESYRVRWVE
jgi:hypothetical protein